MLLAVLGGLNVVAWSAVNIAIILVFLGVAIGLARRVFWSRHTSVMLLFILLPIFSITLFSGRHQPSSQLQNLIASQDSLVAWVIFMVPVCLQLAMACVISQSKPYYRKAWI